MLHIRPLQVLSNLGSALSPSSSLVTSASDAQSMNDLMNVAQSGLSIIGLVLSSSSSSSVRNSAGNMSSSQMKKQAAQITQAANNFALSLLSKKVPGRIFVFLDIARYEYSFTIRVHMFIRELVFLFKKLEHVNK